MHYRGEVRLHIDNNPEKTQIFLFSYFVLNILPRKNPEIWAKILSVGTLFLAPLGGSIVGLWPTPVLLVIKRQPWTHTGMCKRSVVTGGIFLNAQLVQMTFDDMVKHFFLF